MAPTLISRMLCVMLTDAFEDCGAGFPFIYHYDGKLFNQRRLQAKRRRIKREWKIQGGMDRVSQAHYK